MDLAGLGLRLRFQRRQAGLCHLDWLQEDVLCFFQWTALASLSRVGRASFLLFSCAKALDGLTASRLNKLLGLHLDFLDVKALLAPLRVQRARQLLAVACEGTRLLPKAIVIRSINSPFGHIRHVLFVIVALSGLLSQPWQLLIARVRLRRRVHPVVRLVVGVATCERAGGLLVGVKGIGGLHKAAVVRGGHFVVEGLELPVLLPGLRFEGVVDVVLVEVALEKVSLGVEDAHRGLEAAHALAVGAAEVLGLSGAGT